MNHAIIVAAGNSTRFASSSAKQFATLAGRPLIFHTLERFGSAPVIDSIVLVLSAEGTAEFDRLRSGYDLNKLSTVVTGGATRSESVRNGLEAAGAAPDDIVAVHDGARPLVTVDEITRTVETARATGAACLVTAVTDTIKEIADGQIVHTVDRSRLRRALTPQAFRSDLLMRAFEGTELDDSITDECCLLEGLGIRVAAVPGSVWNIKITHAEDLRVAEALLARE